MAQSLAKVYLHVIFSTKGREPVIADGWRDELFHVLGGAVNNLGCQSLVVGGVADHVHILMQLGRTITIADAIGRIKSASSGWVNEQRKTTSAFHLAKRLCRIQCEPIECGGRPRVHPNTTRAPRQTDVSS